MGKNDNHVRLRRRLRRNELFIVGCARAGTTLMHKCLLITGLKNWGPWSLHLYDSEAPIKQIVVRKYPKIKPRHLKPKEKFEIAKAPEFDIVIKNLIELYSGCSFIVMERPLEDRVKSWLATWKGPAIHGYRNAPGIIEVLKKKYKDEFETIYEDDYRFMKALLSTYEEEREKVLKDYDEELICRINFNALMKNWDEEMKKVCDFVGDIDFDFYKPIWDVMRTKKLMATKSDIKKYLS